MNNTIIEAIKKVVSDESFEKEILNSDDSNADKIEKFFQMCKKYSSEEFTREEFDFVLSEFAVLAFESFGNSPDISELDLENVSGGLNLKKFTAASLATLCLVGAVPGPNGIKNLDFTPKASAADGIIGTAKEYITDHPTDAAILVPALLFVGVPAMYKLFKWLAKPFKDDIIMPSVNWFKDTFIYNRRAIGNDPVKFREGLGKALKGNVVAQDKAIEKILNVLSGYIEKWRESAAAGKPCDSACMMTFLGDSGVGKTLTARVISKFVFGKDIQPWQYITESSVKARDTSSNAPKITVNFNSFGMGQSSDSSGETEELSPADRLFHEDSELVRQLRKNPKVVLVFDEIDKYRKYDPDDTILLRARDARDTGKLRIRLRKGGHEDIDISGSIIIFISNEFPECWGLPKRDFTPEEAAARTFTDRNRSMTNRSNPIEFENFKKDSYMVVLRPLLEDIKKTYLKTYNMDLEFSEDFIGSLGQAAEDKNKGVRGLSDSVIELHGKLVECRSKNKISQNKNPKEAKEKPIWKVNIKYNKAEDTFSAEANQQVKD